MSRQLAIDPQGEISDVPKRSYGREDLERIAGALGIRRGPRGCRADTLPFTPRDVTAGAENEFQTVVSGRKEDVDLAACIEGSNFYRNLLRRAASQDIPRRRIRAIQDYIDRNPRNVWEHSWVRFPLSRLCLDARKVFEQDLCSDRTDSAKPARTDRTRFLLKQAGEDCARIPVSYLLKLALADAVGSGKPACALLRRIGADCMERYLSDNTSPEVVSFRVVRGTLEGGVGRELARETAHRYLLTQLLVSYADRRFGLGERGQSVQIYMAPTTPWRQKYLNDHISDTFYRELFISPCLSGWDRGEDKHQYMILCHEVLSRSRLNAIWKLREAGIISRDLVVFPGVSNTSLTNNGTHVSLGSLRQTEILREGHPGFTPRDEKYVGDFVIKIVEHFMPLLVGTYSAAPYRFDYSDFLPEHMLGFLPHEIDFTHLRMLWHRWKAKADLRILRAPLPPFGIRPLDRAIGSLFRLRGDWVPDFRLLDFLASPLSTDECPALDGIPGNDLRLKRDLSQMGVFDPRMPLYLLYRLRSFHRMGFSGYEGRQYSAFLSLAEDLSAAVTLQALITALAYQYFLAGTFDHTDIPHDPTSESEWRQIFFASAMGIPTFFVRSDTRNRFLSRVLQRTPSCRPSRRYAGYTRVPRGEYLLSLVNILKEDSAELIEIMGAEWTIRDLEERLREGSERRVDSRMARAISERIGVSDPLKASAEDFNTGAEDYFRGPLRESHLRECWELFEDACAEIEIWSLRRPLLRHALMETLGETDARRFCRTIRPDLFQGTLGQETLRTLIRLSLLLVAGEKCGDDPDDDPSVH